MPRCFLTTLLLLSGLAGRAQFTEVSEALGISHRYEDYTQISGGVAIFDMNNDSLPDLYLTGGLLSDKLYINNGNGFTRTVNYFDPEDFGYYEHYSTGVTAGDVNNDGFDDLIVCGFRDYPTLLFLNRGNGRFDALPPAESGIDNAGKWSTGASLGDLNGDGWLDLFVHSYIDTGRSEINPEDSLVVFQHIGFRNDLYLNRGDGTFEQATETYGLLKRGNTLNSAFTDYDNDGDADLYVVNDFGRTTQRNELYENLLPQPGVLDVSRPSNADIGIFGMGLAIGDYDGDGDPDYYVTNIGRNVLLRNLGNGLFGDATDQAGVGDSATLGGNAVGWATGFIDYDNDGWQDLFIANGYIASAAQIFSPIFNPNAIFRNNGDGTFTDVRQAMEFTDPSIFRGGAVGDLNGDGLLDIVLVPSNKPNETLPAGLRKEVAVYYNETPGENRWLAVKLQGSTSNRSGYGARLRLYLNDGRELMRDAGNLVSYASANSPWVHFGLGQAAADSLVIFWPSGLRQSVRSPGSDYLLVVEEGVDPQIPLSVALQEETRWSVRPNPVISTLHLDFRGSTGMGGPVPYRIFGLTGELRADGVLDPGQPMIAVDGLLPGHYVLVLESPGRGTSRIAFVKQ